MIADGNDTLHATLQSVLEIQYIPRNMHTVFAFLCFVVVIYWQIFPYPPGLLHWHCGNLSIAPVPAKQPWWIWINTSCELIMNDCITTTKQSTTKLCAYFLGYTVRCRRGKMQSPHDVISQIILQIRHHGYTFSEFTWWRHQMETFSALLAICAGNSPVPGEFPTQRQRRGALIFSLICVWINGWVNNRDAGNLRRYRAH